MIYQNVELHNCAQVTEIDGAIQLQRIPDEVRLKLNPGAQNRAIAGASSEIRFVHGDGGARVTLSCGEGAAPIIFFYGDYRHCGLIFLGQEPRTFDLNFTQRMREVWDRLDQGCAFSPSVCRIVLGGNQLRLHSIEGEVRPPNASELPGRRYLAYGTSITHGGAAVAPHLCYAVQTARRLGADLLNFGLGGSCHCEPELADYFASRDDWDFATLALSVNMINQGFSAEQFRERVHYLVNRLAKAKPEAPIACITLWPYFADLGGQAPKATASPEEYRRILREVAEAAGDNVHCFEGPDLFPGPGGLTTDMLHPADDGMIGMGEALAERLAPLLAHLPDRRNR